MYIELVSLSKKDTTEYFYYALVNKSIISNINSDHQKNRLFTLSNVRYINNNDLLEIYEDNRLTGDIIFNTKDIKQIILYKDDPINVFKIEELHDSSKKLRMKNELK